jgi:hypothetical protein
MNKTIFDWLASLPQPLQLLSLLAAISVVTVVFFWSFGSGRQS